MKVLIADLFSQAAIDEMKKAGIEVAYNDKLSGETLTAELAKFQPNVLVVRSTKVVVADIDASAKLQLVVRAGAGTDTIDVKYCAKQGIYVANCPGKNAHAVSELTIGMMLSIDRRMAEGNQMLHDGKWNKGMFAKCLGVKGRTIGLIGCGAIAQLVCKTACALEMKVLVHTRTEHPDLAEKLGFEYRSLDDLLAQSDIVSLHVPGSPETAKMVNKSFLSKMKPDGVLLNTARGNVIVDDDLIAHLDASPAFWYGTDVFNGEPTTATADWSSAVSKHPRCYGTHHCGASTAQAENAIGAEALRVIQKFVKTGEIDLENTVNRAKLDKSLKKMCIRHKDKVGVLAKVFEVLAANEINIQELQNIVFAEREACVANLMVSCKEETNIAEVAAQVKASCADVLDVTY